MRLIDDKGKLFGLINVVDLGLLVVLVLLGARLGLKSRVLTAVNPSSMQTVEVVLLVEDVRSATSDAMTEGDTVLNTKSNAVLGSLTKVDAQPAMKEVMTADGELLMAESPFRKDVYLTVRGQGQVTQNVIMLGGYEMRVGATVQVKGLKFAVISTVYAVKVAD